MEKHDTQVESQKHLSTEISSPLNLKVISSNVQVEYIQGQHQTTTSKSQLSKNEYENIVVEVKYEHTHMYDSKLKVVELEKHSDEPITSMSYNDWMKESIDKFFRSIEYSKDDCLPSPRSNGVK